ncbi:hypothetical protein E4U54_008087 [Claviceps lovelessii]|nr:hypothetical protein E4U54_008087 [Claviceps lovelessii]
MRTKVLPEKLAKRIMNYLPLELSLDEALMTDLFSHMTFLAVRKERSNVRTLLKELVDDPDELLLNMRVSNTMLIGPMALEHFLPGTAIKGTEWSFQCDRDHYRRFVFVRYMEKLGFRPKSFEVTFVPADERDASETENSAFFIESRDSDMERNDPREMGDLYGTIPNRRKGSPDHIVEMSYLARGYNRLAAMQYNTTAYQCFITGSGSYSPYSSLTRHYQAYPMVSIDCKGNAQCDREHVATDGQTPAYGLSRYEVNVDYFRQIGIDIVRPHQSKSRSCFSPGCVERGCCSSSRKRKRGCDDRVRCSMKGPYAFGLRHDAYVDDKAMKIDFEYADMQHEMAMSLAWTQVDSADTCRCCNLEYIKMGNIRQQEVCSHMALGPIMSMAGIVDMRFAMSGLTGRIRPDSDSDSDSDSRSGSGSGSGSGSTVLGDTLSSCPSSASPMQPGLGDDEKVTMTKSLENCIAYPGTKANYLAAPPVQLLAGIPSSFRLNIPTRLGLGLYGSKRVVGWGPSDGGDGSVGVRSFMGFPTVQCAWHLALSLVALWRNYSCCFYDTHVDFTQPKKAVCPPIFMQKLAHMAVPSPSIGGPADEEVLDRERYRSLQEYVLLWTGVSSIPQSLVAAISQRAIEP